MNQLTIYCVDDWQVLYVNGIEVFQHHRITMRELSKHCPIESIHYQWIDMTPLEEYVQNNGKFPQSLEDAKGMLE